MMNRMGRVMAVVGLSIGLAAPVMAESDVTITSGSPGGTYHNVFGANLGRILSEYGTSTEVATSAGSLENLQRLASGDADVGFTQADALDSFLDKNPTANIEIMGGLGKECIYVATSEDGLKNEDGLEREGTKIAVGDQGSGSAESWDYMRTLEEGYQNSSTYYTGGARALAQVKTGELDAFLWITSPSNLNHDFLKMVMQDGSGLRLIDMNDWDMNNEMSNGQQVYEFRDVVVQKGFFDKEIETACTQVLVVASGGLDTQVLEQVAKAVMMNSNRIQGK